MLSLTLADLANGTGILATVAGSDTGSANTVYTSPVALGNGVSWTNSGSRTGNGTLTLALPPGYTYAYCAGTVLSAPAVSVPVIGVASLAVQSVQQQCELAIQARVQGLTLTGLATPPGNLPPSRCYRFDAPMNDLLLAKVSLPCHITTPFTGPETAKQVVNTSEDIGWPVQSLLLDRFSPLEQGRADTIKLWRQQIDRAVRFQRLATVPQVFTVVPEYQPVIAWRPPEYDFVYSAVVYRCFERDPRG